MNTIIHGDCLEEMRKLPPGSFRAVVTSPPYNLKAVTVNPRKSLWTNSKLMAEGYDGYEDRRSDEEYVAWQRDCLTEMMRLIDDTGAIFYNHHWKVKDGLLQQHNELIKGLPLRQIIIWWRRSGFNFNNSFFRPNYEVIYLFAKPGFKLANGANSVGAVWDIMPERNNPHPAPFPVELARRCVAAVGSGPILDPFCGSGTTGVAAKRCGFDFTGIEQSEKYCEMARARLSKAVDVDLF